MLTLTGYTIEDKIYESDSSIIYRGIRKIDNSTVILKLLKEEYPSLEKVSRFMHEYEILKILDEAVTVAVYDFIRYKNSFVIILKDGGQDLQQYLDSRPRLQLSEAVQLAIGITESLDNVHKRHIIHKDVNPSNILLDSSIEKIKVIDFGISSKLPKEMLEVFSLNQLEGTLDYMSPEQTGRMNRGIDYRSDYYSLGATFYQIFTGVLPFTSKDTLELVYSHIAKLPASPSQVDPAIPKIISDIIMKLLEKTAEKRYQSGYGLITDLQNCLLQLQKTGLCNEFPLGLNDYSGRFQVPDKLYGRESEINYLLDTFSRVSSGSSELMLVAGYSGIGKSSLVHEVHKPIVKKHGYFISGKFDLLKRNIPYAPFVQAFEGLIQQILTENKETVDECKEKIIAALGPNGGVMTEVLPSLVKIIGEQAPIIALGPMETQNRFISVFQNFVHTLATEQHPLVIFLDDLQWVDLPSLKLLQSILSQTAIKYLLIVGAYRDNEVNAAHPLMLTIDNFKKMNIPLNTLTLGPLKVTDVQQLLTDTLSQEPDVVQSLAVICHAKTLGNPFFLNQFLRSLCDEDLITFNTSRGIWHWVIEKVKTRTGTDNVVEVVINNIQKLLPETRSMLAYAACLGHRFDLQALSVLYGKSPKQTAAALEEALSENFILPIDESYRYISEDKDANAYYQFLHDRVQQAAYTLPTENEKKVSHLKIGRYYIQNLPVDKQEELLFDIVNQINLGIDLITMPDEKLDLARLNLRAGRKAKSSAAYSIALDHFHFCLGLLPPDAWSTQYDLTLELHTEAAEAAYLSDNFVETERLSGIVFSHAHSILDQVKIYEINIYTSIARNKPSDAVVISLEVLKKLGIKFPKNPNQFHAILSILKTKWILMGKSNDRLVNLPVMSDPFKLNACNILSAAIAPTYYAAPALYPLFTLALLNLSIQYGYNKGAPAAYASYGIILCGVLGEINRGHTFGQLALNLIEYFQAVESEAKVALMVSGFVNHWKEPYRNSLAPLLVAHLRGIEAGDLDFSAYSAYFYIVFSLYAGVELNQIAEDTKKFHQVCLNQHTHGLAVHSIALVGQVVESLQGLTTDPSVINGSWYKGETMLQEAIDINHGFEAFHYYVLKIMLSVFFYNFDAAHQAMLAAPAYISAATGGIPLKAYNFYGSLARIALCENATTAEKRAHLKIVAANQKQLKHWMKSAPENCLHKYYLVEAELARLHKKIDYAEKFYDKAMQLSKQYEFVQEHALASELAAKFYLAEGKEMVAKGYMTEAYYSYTKWGAVAKLRHLESNYSHLLSQTPTSSALAAGTIQGSITNYASESLDLSTVVKASQTIAREIVLADLLKQLMSFLIENAGAQKGYLLLEKEGRWTIEASVDADKVTVLQSLPFENEMPQSVIQYVIHSKESVVLDDATTASQFNSDPYILHVKPKSILSIPLLNQGVLSGVLYLENNLMTGAFTQNRVDLLNLLSTQIVISIENARLYTGMKNLNLAYERFIPKEFLSALEKKNIIDVKLGDQVQKDMTVMFCDIRNFTAISEKLTPQENFAFVNNFLSRLEPSISEFGGFIDKYIGDSIMAIYPSNTDSALTSAINMLKVLNEYNERHPELAPIHIGIGLNSGLLMLGIVGAEHHMEGTVISDVVNVASRTEGLTKTYSAELLITEETYKRLRNPAMYSIRRLDTVLAKGKSKLITIYEVFDSDAESAKFLKIQTKTDFEQGAAYFYQENYNEAQKTFEHVLRINPADKAAQLYLERCKQSSRA